MKSHTKRDGEFTEMPKAVRLRAARLSCAICHRKYGSYHVTHRGKLVVLTQAIHHIIPRRFCMKLRIDPHAESNLVSICNICHGEDLEIEANLWKGNAYDFVRGHAQHGWPEEILLRAAAHAWLKEIQKLVRLTA